MEQLLRESVARPKFNMVLLAAVAGVALALAAIGTCGRRTGLPVKTYLGP